MDCRKALLIGISIGVMGIGGVLSAKPRRIPKPKPQLFLVQSEVNRDEKGKMVSSINRGFSETSFHYDDEIRVNSTDFCYIGRADKVCPIIDKAIKKMQKEYSEGAHDTAELKSCTVQTIEGKVYVLATYNLHDDYGGNVDAFRKIGRCE